MPSNNRRRTPVDPSGIGGFASAPAPAPPIPDQRAPGREPSERISEQYPASVPTNNNNEPSTALPPRRVSRDASSSGGQQQQPQRPPLPDPSVVAAPKANKTSRPQRSPQPDPSVAPVQTVHGNISSNHSAVSSVTNPPLAPKNSQEPPGRDPSVAGPMGDGSGKGKKSPKNSTNTNTSATTAPMMQNMSSNTTNNMKKAPSPPVPSPVMRSQTAPTVTPSTRFVTPPAEQLRRQLSPHRQQLQQQRSTRPGLNTRASTRSRISNVQFRTIAEDVAVEGGSFFSVQDRTLNIEESFREVPEFSVISVAARHSTLPMAADNVEFFQGEDGYAQVLDYLEGSMQKLEADGRAQHWNAARNETSGIGRVWRGLLQAYIKWTNDAINRLRVTRGLQDFVPFQTIYESLLVAGIIRSLDQELRQKDKLHFSLAFHNRNVSRAIVQTLGRRYDWLWHWSTQVSRNRLFDVLSQFPFLGWLGFPATENFPSTKNFAIRAIVRAIGAEGQWLTRALTGNLQGLVTHQKLAPAQNLAAESNDFEQLNRDQYGTYIGRQKTNAFRLEHRLTTDESIVRTFMVSPASTMLNNGVEHVLRCLAKHWHNMLYQENGNFAHQRMEQLDPFEILRFHMPEVLVTLTNLRGRHALDAVNLGPFMKLLQTFNPAKVQKRYESQKQRNAGVGGAGMSTIQAYDEEAAMDQEGQVIHGACAAAKGLVAALRDDLAEFVCGGIPSRLQPFQDWLDAISEALVEIEIEAKEVSSLVHSVERGIRLGYRLLKVIDWHTATPKALAAAIKQYIQNPSAYGGNAAVVAPSLCIFRAMEKLAPKDKRTLKELVLQGYQNSEPCKLLMGRTVTLLKRELWRKALDDRIVGLSKGPPVEPKSLVKNKWYWLGQTNPTTKEKTWSVCIFTQRSKATKRLRFVDVDINIPLTVEPGKIELLTYIPVAEAIARAQRVFMTIELDHGKKFTYNSFMEFGDPTSESSLRTRLRRLATVAQLQCSELDKARLNTLTEMKKTARPRPDRTPQNVIVVGGGPTGLLAAIHCVQNVMMSGGEVRIYEDRDSFEKEAATYERAQIVRLDSRQISMLRYHLGTSYEDIFVPASGETDPHLGNTIPEQGFVEVTIKRLEYMLQEEALRLNSKELLKFFSKSRINVDSGKGIVKKAGKSLKLDDLVYLENRDGVWQVKEFVYEEQLKPADMAIGAEYDILPRGAAKVRRFKLDTKDEDLDHYHFAAQEPKVEDIAGRFHDLPPIYPSGKGRIDPNSIVFAKTGPGAPQLELVPYDDAMKKEYRLNVADSHIIVAAGKPKESPLKKTQLREGQKYDLISRDDGMPRRFKLEQMSTEGDFYAFSSQESGVGDVFGNFAELPPVYPAGSTHFHVTTEEPYAVCCIEGLKIAMGMHNFGEQRWGSGLFDDVRSVNDQNTRIIGDFTKSVALVPCVERMIEKLEDDKVWSVHFDHVPDDYDENLSGVADSLLTSVKAMLDKGFVRQRLQTRFFELGDNYYLGMELAREFDKMKNEFVKNLVPEARQHAMAEKKRQKLQLRAALMRSIDRLWYESTLEVIARGDVYNPGGRSSIPQLYTIDSPLEQSLGELDVCEAFVFAHRPYVVAGNEGMITTARLESGNAQYPFPNETPVKDMRRGAKTILSKLKMGDRFEPLASFEVLFKKGGYSIVRNTAGYVVKMSHSIKVHRISNLSRAPDGYSESKVALASFPVAHVVCNRALKLNVRSPTSREGYIMAFVGDGQASPHFMRYSGLTGACINCMSFNNLVAQSVAGIDFKTRVQRYALETNWSNGEVVQRGTGANYGQDGFLRPGFTYTHLVDYLFEKAMEYDETKTELQILSRDWKIKIAASLVPRGLETDAIFLYAMVGELRKVLKQKFEDQLLIENMVENLTPADKEAISRDLDQYMRHWDQSNTTFQPSIVSDTYSSKTSMHIKSVIDALTGAINHSVELRADNKRISSEMFTQPKPVDSVVDDFAVEAQNFANSLTQSVAFAVSAIALRLFDDSAADIISPILSIISIVFAFGTMTNVSRYKNRNEEARRMFANEKYLKVTKAVFGLLRRDEQDQVPYTENPFAVDLDNKVQFFLQRASYYGYSDNMVKPFREAYGKLKTSMNNDVGAAPGFMRRIVEEFIPITFHANSYLQEMLVGIYKSCSELRQSRAAGAPTEGGGPARKAFQMLKAFQPKLEASLESEQIRYGFFKSRKISQWAIVVTIRYFLSCFFPCLIPSVGRDTQLILREMKRIRAPPSHQAKVLRAQVDVRELYHATNESNIASAVFLTGALVFTAGIIFTIFRIISIAADEEADWVGYLLDATGWAVLLSLFGAILALLHFFRKTKHLVRLYSLLGKTKNQRGGANTKPLRHIMWVTLTQIMLTFVRILTNVTACVALPWFLVTSQFLKDASNEDDLLINLPAYIAALSALLALYSVLFFFFVEFWIRYRLDATLGRVIFEQLRPTIEGIKDSFGKSDHSDIETYQNLEREAWEYTAREFLHDYRFDTVFAADRFGSILQYIQSQYLLENQK